MQAKPYGFWLSCLHRGWRPHVVLLRLRLPRFSAEYCNQGIADLFCARFSHFGSTLLGDHRYSGIVCSSTLVAQPREWYAVVKFNNGKGSKICGFVGQHFPLVLQRLLRCLAIAPVVLLFRCVALGIASSLWPLFLVVGLSRVCADSSR